MKIIRRIIKALFHRPRRLALRFVPYSEADKLINEGWNIAKDYEDDNTVPGFVYLELLEQE